MSDLAGSTLATFSVSMILSGRCAHLQSGCFGILSCDARTHLLGPTRRHTTHCHPVRAAKQTALAAAREPVSATAWPGEPAALRRRDLQLACPRTLTRAPRTAERACAKRRKSPAQPRADDHTRPPRTLTRWRGRHRAPGPLHGSTRGSPLPMALPRAPRARRRLPAPAVPPFVSAGRARRFARARRAPRAPCAKHRRQAPSVPAGRAGASCMPPHAAAARAPIASHTCVLLAQLRVWNFFPRHAAWRATNSRQILDHELRANPHTCALLIS